MKFSQETMHALKNMAGINSNLVFREGHVLNTISEARNILATVEIPEIVPCDFGIYDLHQFLSLINMFDEPDLSISSKCINIAQGPQSVQYFTAAEAMLTSPPNKGIDVPEPGIIFELTDSNIASLRKVAATIGVDDVVISGNAGDDNVDIAVTALDNSTSNTYSINIPCTKMNDSFKAVYNINNFKFLPGTYQVGIASMKNRLVSIFTLLNTDAVRAKYLVALEVSSSIGE